MISYHRGVTIKAVARPHGHTFVAHVSLTRENGEVDRIGDLGWFANQRSAIEFARRTGLAAVEQSLRPKAPFTIAQPASHPASSMPSP